MSVNYLRPEEIINRYFNHVLKALRQLHNDYIRPPNTLFNLRHSSLRTTIERAFGLLRRHFRIINETPCLPFPTQVEIVLVCNYILYNFILGLNTNDEFLNEITIKESTQLISRRKTRREEREDNAMWASIRDRIANEIWNDYS
ncbi:hypothetical protein Taro_032646, partial [Colocasia esculenta]|nr:hypothetical protein [Colocasia esculenta]